jgi:pyridoxal phosphate enzyme (YggS family)
MTTIAARLQAVNERIAAAARAAGRPPQDVALVAVSKTFPTAAVAEGHAAGQRAFGENYVQEALDKMAALASLDIEWHFIGPIQSNKTRPIAQAFAWVHGIDRQKIAQRLSDARPAGLAPLQVCLQVNVSGEASKSGVDPADAPALARAVAGLPRLRLRGLMAIPEPTEDAALQRSRFRRLRELKDEIAAAGIALDTLSMGMSGDMEAAIAEGATMVRIGTAIFGARPAIRASIA